jgi:hypothetical protein
MSLENNEPPDAAAFLHRRTGLDLQGRAIAHLRDSSGKGGSVSRVRRLIVEDGRADHQGHTGSGEP